MNTKRFKFLTVLLLMLFSVILFAACSKKDVAIKSISITNWPSGEVDTATLPFQLGYNVNPADATNVSVTWSSSDSEVASITQDGTVTPLKAGLTSIVVRAQQGDVVRQATQSLRVLEERQPIESISIPALEGNKISIGYGTYRFEPITTPSRVFDYTAEWTSSNIDVATIETVIENGQSVGVLTIKDLGTTTIKVKVLTSQGEAVANDISDEITIEINNPKLNLLAFDHMYTSSSKYDGSFSSPITGTVGTTSMRAPILPAVNNEFEPIDYSGYKYLYYRIGSSGAVGDIGYRLNGVNTFNDLFVADGTIHEGIVRLYEDVEGGGNWNVGFYCRRSGLAGQVYFYDAYLIGAPQGLIITNATNKDLLDDYIVNNKTTRQLGYNYFTESEEGPIVDNSKVTSAIWSSSNPSVAEISSTGMIEFKELGETTITLTVIAEGKTYTESQLIVLKNEPKISIQNNTKKDRVYVGDVFYLDYNLTLLDFDPDWEWNDPEFLEDGETPNPNRRPNGNIIWSSNNNSVTVETVIENGRALGKVTAMGITDGNGVTVTAKITVPVLDENGEYTYENEELVTKTYSDGWKFSIIAPEILFMNKPEQTLTVGNRWTVEFAPFGFQVDNIPNMEDVRVTSSDSNIAVIEDGVLIALAQGTVTISLELINEEEAITYRDSFVLNVIPSGLFMQIMDKQGAYNLNETPTLNAVIMDGLDPVIDQTITWTVDNTDIAEIDAETGVLTLKATGSVTVTASATVNENSISDSYTFTVFKGIEDKLYLTGLTYSNSGSGSNGDGSYTFSKTGTGTRTVQSIGTGSDYSGPIGAAGKIADDFCKAALADGGKLYLTVVFEHSSDNGSLILRIRGLTGNPADFNFASHGGYIFAEGKRTMTFDLTEHWADYATAFNSGLAIMWAQTADGSITIYDAFLHTSMSMSDGIESDGVYIQNAQLFRNGNAKNEGNGKYGGADTFARLLSENEGKRQLIVGSFENFEVLNASEVAPIWLSSNEDVISIDSATGEITFLSNGKAYITVTYKINDVIYGDKVLIDMTDLGQ